MIVRLSLLILVILCQASVAIASDLLTVVHDAKDHLVIEFNANAFGSYTTHVNGKQKLIVVSDGLNNNVEAGAPSLPHLSQLISVPPGSSPRVKIISQVVKTQGLQAPVAASVGARVHCAPPAREVIEDAAAFVEAKSAPLVEISDVSFMGPLAVAMLTINPVQLTENELEIKTTRKFIARIDFGSARKTAPVINVNGLNHTAFDFYRGMVLNRAALPTYKANKNAVVDFIIADPTYAEALQPLIRYKEAAGRQVILKTMTGASREQVSQAIREQYLSNIVPTHTILVGNIDQIPSNRRSNYWSDYGYTLLDDGNYPDLSIARIPARSVTELENVVAKIITRETTPRNNGAFLLTSGFEVDWCQKNLKFMTDNIFANSQIPIEVTKLYASQGARTAKVTQGYNTNPNVIIYDGHGDSTGMIEIPLLLSHLGGLRNTTPPLIMDIACLNSFWPSSGATTRNFAESILTLNSAGAAGILAASSNSGGHELFRHIFRASVYDEGDEQQPYHEINEVGTAVLYGKIKYLLEFNGKSNVLSDNHMFYYHGDPASTFFQQTE